MRKLIFLIFITLISCGSCKEQISPVLHKENFLFSRAKVLYNNNNDSAFYYFNKYTSLGKDSLDLATAYNYMASIQSDAGDYFGSSESVISSLKLLNEFNPAHRQCFASDYNELGMACLNLKQVKEAINYFDKALKFSDNDVFKNIIYNNQARAYQDYNNYNRAIAIYKSAIKVTPVNTLAYARIATNLTMARWSADPKYSALPDLLKALTIRKGKNDLAGENSSYSKLSDFYLYKKPDSAFFYAQKMYETATKLHNSSDKLSALKKLIKCSPISIVRVYIDAYQLLNDSVQTVKNAAKNQFALIRYDSEKNKADNLRLQKDNAENRYQLLVRNILLLASIMIVVLGIIYGFTWYRIYRNRKDREKQDAVLQARRAASKDVHDSLSTDIYLLMKRVKHDSVLDRNWLQQQTELVYQISRDISYEMVSGVDGKSFPEQLADRLMSFGTEDVIILLVLNNESFWEPISIKTRLELRLVLQQLMVNMQKHSSARNVIFRFQVKENTRSIIYTDDGIGIPDGTVHQNGLINAETRIKEIGGTITFDSNDGKGLMIQLDFPVT